MQYWPPQLIERLRKLAAEGRRASDIAALLGHGLTKNAVIGKCWREGIRLGYGPDGQRVTQPGPKPEDCRRNIKGQFAPIKAGE